MIDNEDKNSWCQAGELAEKDFVATNKIAGWGLAVNPQKQLDPYCHDLLGIIPVDLKSIREPWRKSLEMFGIPTEYAVSINLKDFKRYASLYPNIIIVLDVEWSGVYMITVQRAKALITSGKAIKHEYKNRKEDENGNAKSSFVFDLRDLDKLERH